MLGKDCVNLSVICGMVMHSMVIVFTGSKNNNDNDDNNNNNEKNQRKKNKKNSFHSIFL